MATQPINQRYVQSVVLDGTGAGSLTIVPRADFACQQTSWRVQGGTGTSQSTAQVELNGDFWQGTYSGNNDASPTARLITNNDIVTCEWTGGPPGGTATLTMFGLEYPAGTGIPPPAAGGGPSNPILGGETLIRNSIQSEDYVAGVSGWAIFRDGSVEFNNGEFRGEVNVQGVNGAYVKINNFAGFPAVCILPQSLPGLIQWDALIEGDSFGSGATSRSVLDLASPYPDDGAGNQAQFALIELISSTTDRVTVPSEIDLAAARIEIGNGTSTTANVQGTLTIRGIDRGRGLVRPNGTGNWSIVNSAAIAAGAEATMLTYGSVTYAANRAYQVVHKGQATLGTAITNSILYFRIRRDDGSSPPTGTIVRPLGRAPMVSTQTMAVDQQGVFVTSAAVTATLILTMTVPGGTTGTHNADATFPRKFDIFDIGAAADYPEAPVLT